MLIVLDMCLCECFSKKRGVVCCLLCEYLVMLCIESLIWRCGGHGVTISEGLLIDVARFAGFGDVGCRRGGFRV